MDQPPTPTDVPQLWTDEERWQVLMESVKDFGIFMLDPSGRIATWNLGAERLLGYMTNEIIGQPFSRIFTAEDVQKQQPEFELREAREKGRCEDERWHVRKDGGEFWASGVMTPLWADDGTLRGYAKVVRDITDRKMAELNIADSNRRKDEFLAMLSHEFRNPLAAILNATQLMKLEGSATPTQLEATQIIERQAGGLTRMVDDLLDISRISEGKLQLHRQRVELCDLISHALEVCQPLIESQKHSVVQDFTEETIWLDGDPQRLVQIISNLLVNAAKYTDPGGTITIKTRRQGKQALVHVRDTGSGILSEMLPRIFEPFVQADRSLERSQGGLGIGLALVKRIADMHGGRVEAFSEGIGKGSEFVLQLPAITDDVVSQNQSTSEPKVEVSEQKLQIIVAEDNPDAAKILSMVLERFGHGVKIVSSGTAVLQAVAESKPDVLILDIGLPGMDGYRVAEAIRSKTDFESLCLIAMTGFAHEEDRIRAQQAGFDHHLAKPVDLAVLQKILSDLSSQRSRAD